MVEHCLDITLSKISMQSHGLIHACLHFATAICKDGAFMQPSKSVIVVAFVMNDWKDKYVSRQPNSSIHACLASHRPYVAHAQTKTEIDYSYTQITTNHTRQAISPPSWCWMVSAWSLWGFTLYYIYTSQRNEYLHSTYFLLSTHQNKLGISPQLGITLQKQPGFSMAPPFQFFIHIPLLKTKSKIYKICTQPHERNGIV